jgi:hypothetical protein
MRTVIAALALSFLAAEVLADPITVCGDGTCDYTSINAAIDAANPGDVILLSAETYTEGRVINTDGKAITIRGVLDKAGEPASVLDGANTHRLLTCPSGETGSTVFENLVIQNGSAAGLEIPNYAGGGMYNLSSSPTLRNCKFYSNVAHSGGGMHNEESEPALTDCKFLGNNAVEGGGMYNGDNSSPVLTGCTFTGNSAINTFPDSHDGRGGAILSEETSSVTAVDCVFSGNEPDSILGNFTTSSAPCTPGDMDGDEDVDADDFVALRDQIGVDALGCVAADINGDGDVGPEDLALLLGSWGVCP